MKLSRGVGMKTERELKLLLEDKIEAMAKALHQGKDIEIKVLNTIDGISVKEVRKSKL